MGIFQIISPTRHRLLGAGNHDEVALTVGDTSETATILAIDKPSTPGVNEERPATPQWMEIQPNAPRDIVGERSTRPAVGASGNPTAREISKTLSPRTTSQDRPIVDTSKPAPKDGTLPASARNRNTPAPHAGAKHDRILDDLRTLDAQFQDPRCPECCGLADLAINSEGPVVRCASGGCKWAERVDVQTLQRLADHLPATCRQCKGTNLA